MNRTKAIWMNDWCKSIPSGCVCCCFYFIDVTVVVFYLILLLFLILYLTYTENVMEKHRIVSACTIFPLLYEPSQWSHTHSDTHTIQFSLNAVFCHTKNNIMSNILCTRFSMLQSKLVLLYLLYWVKYAIAVQCNTMSFIQLECHLYMMWYFLSFLLILECMDLIWFLEYVYAFDKQ